MEETEKQCDFAEKVSAIHSWRRVHGEVFLLVTSYERMCMGKRIEISFLSLWIWDLRPVSEWCY